MVQIVTDDTFQEFVESNPVAVIDCWAVWCGPCRFLSPVIDQLSEEKKDVTFGKLNVDENALVPIKYGIMSIPTLLYFKDGELVNRTVGALPKKAIEDVLAKLTG
ncbi:MAG: thioredoxin [Candidatus Bathyarchaeota archaeon]|nr:MAG: thioredoxin [Candidatus Bathyarchaeota archaeon]